MYPREGGAVVKVLVGRKDGDRFSGFWAQFEGEEVARYEDARADKHVVYTLYRCTAYNYEAYRVHVADESDPATPVYELHPVSEQSGVQGIRPDYSEPLDKQGLAANYPLFLKDIDYFHVLHVDPMPRGG